MKSLLDRFGVHWYLHKEELDGGYNGYIYLIVLTFSDTFHDPIKQTPNQAWNAKVDDKHFPKNDPVQYNNHRLVSIRRHWDELHRRNTTAAAYLKKRHETKFGRAAIAKIGDIVLFIHPRLASSKYWSKTKKKMDGKGQIVSLIGETHAVVHVFEVPEFYQASWQQGPVKVFLQHLHKTGHEESLPENARLRPLEELHTDDFSFDGDLDDIHSEGKFSLCN